MKAIAHIAAVFWICQALYGADLTKEEPNHPVISLDIRSAILMALKNNAALAVQKVQPQIQRTYEQEQAGVFDMQIEGAITPRRTVADRLSRAGSGLEKYVVTDGLTGSVSLSVPFPTGTSIALSGSTSYTDSSLYSDTFTSTRLGLTVTQALLQGLDIQTNLARIEQAKLDTKISEYELRAVAEALVEQVEQAFWDYALAQRQVEIYADSLQLARQQLDQTQERVKIGRLAETELAAAQAEVALRQENLINATSELARRRIELLRLLNPNRKIDWDSQLKLQYQLVMPQIVLDEVDQHVQVAFRLRPELNQARLLIRRGQLEVVQTSNGLLPRLDLFIDLGKSGYANSFANSLSDLDGHGYDYSIGLQLAYPLGNRTARARYTRVVATGQQLRLALENLQQLVEVDVRSAYIEVERTRQQIQATAATRLLQEEKLRAESEKFKVGRSTSLLVAQAQRDLVASQIAESQALANHLKALVRLFRLEGSLLQRRGLDVPGGQPIDLPSQ
ncbi:MAG: TolC family protein [Sedimentisphaerales bacterium]|nr:TolC family protein [Sedimentisphaerales bacterium]